MIIIFFSTAQSFRSVRSRASEKTIRIWFKWRQHRPTRRMKPRCHEGEILALFVLISWCCLDLTYSKLTPLVSSDSPSNRKWQSWIKLSHGMRFPTMWYVRPPKAQTSLSIRAVRSEPLLVARIFYECLTTDWTTFGDSKLKRRLHWLVRVYTCQNTTLLEITCHG